MIDKRFLFFRTKESFERELDLDNISQQSIVFIKDANAIWTHNTYFHCTCEKDTIWTLGDTLPIILSTEWDAIPTQTINVDREMSSISENPVQNKVIYQAIQNIQEKLNSIPSLSYDIEDYLKKNDFKSYVNQYILNYLQGSDYMSKNEFEKWTSNYYFINANGSNIKTINGQSLLGTGNLTIQGGSTPVSTPVLNMSVSPTSLQEYTGRPITYTVRYSITKDGVAVTPTVVELVIDNTQVRKVTSTPSTTITITNAGNHTITVRALVDDQTLSKSVTCSIVRPTYFGLSTASTRDELSISSLQNKTIISSFGSLQNPTVFTVQNNVAGSYIWVVSPCSITKVGSKYQIATDPSFFATVDIDPDSVYTDSTTGLHYYRSVQKLDIGEPIDYYIR